MVDRTLDIHHSGGIVQDMMRSTGNMSRTMDQIDERLANIQRSLMTILVAAFCLGGFAMVIATVVVAVSVGH